MVSLVCFRLKQFEVRITKNDALKINFFMSFFIMTAKICVCATLSHLFCV
ncbi:MAG: hypothetical protein H6Q20_1934 [Bacteroidetes bacterium]|nr:hypothetical protein [Bacteroidota bacterium]